MDKEKYIDIAVEWDRYLSQMAEEDKKEVLENPNKYWEIFRKFEKELIKNI